MNRLDRVLSEDLGQLLDRLSASTPKGALERMSRAQRDRLDDVEKRLAAARLALRDAYVRWERTLEDAENLYAVAAWREEAEEWPARVQSRAA